MIIEVSRRAFGRHLEPGQTRSSNGAIGQDVLIHKTIKNGKEG